jgi:hypothetical protein
MFRMWRIAAGYLAMSFAEFGALSPRELQWRLEQTIEREHREFHRVAQLACWVINPWLKPGQQILPHHLIGRRPLPPPSE